MKEYYSAERNVQIVIALLKAYNIKKIVASPGTTNIPFVCSAQFDRGFLSQTSDFSIDFNTSIVIYW